MSDNKKNVLITGTSTGIGRATALRLDRNGFRVFAGVRREEDAESLQKEGSESLTPVILDVTDANCISNVVAYVTEQIGDAGLHGLVNNAGVAVAGPVEGLTLDEWRRQFEVAFFGAVSMIRAFFPLLRMATGRIINISSVSGRIVAPFIGPYVAAKHSLEAMSDSLRQEIRKWGMRVSIIEPGMVVTPMVREKAKQNYSEIREGLSSEMREHYGAVLDAFEKNFADWENHGMPPEKVAKTIERALTSRWPRARYIVGWDARLAFALKWLLPHSWMDWAIKKLLGLPQ